VVPVFVAGLRNSLLDILARRIRGGERIRVRFGPALDGAEWAELPPTAASSRAVAEQVMQHIRGLGEQDRRAMALADASSDSQRQPLPG
jgi:hypothetical protein